MVRNVAGELRELESADFYLLSGVEHGMRFSEWVDRGTLTEYARLDSEEVDHRLDRCERRGFIERKTMQYQGFRLTFEGYDALALHTLVERDTIEGFGAPLGVGKESDVYEVTSYKPLALKFHREGYTNFREVQREREYTADRNHRSWLYTARKAAEREYDALETVYPTVNVPRPIDHNRHAIVMEKLDGVELSQAALPDEQAIGVLDLILSEVADAYAEGYVHADMSEYNVAVSEQGVMVFDWPQAVQTDHENAEEFLERDIENVLGYFGRKHPGEIGDPSVASIAAGVRDGTFESVENH
ncbi:serine/threonine-protein kinase RIO2 [Halocatena pleomorpha]|uniref:non-specific serine/threonine protein kinase n=1 Tax=Halocatena pleomorpha TaxID=1785090 RepID=A0A3P3RFR9_9EURY|nr:serine/threonine-protein kinase RIO2 [Halocatena pleomorpha]RRJ31273.1 serine/threonine protein phosphatase [Halocatena pleomorpha]